MDAFLHSLIYILILMIVSGFAVSVMSGGIQSVITLVSLSEHRGRLQNYLYWVNNVGALLGLLVASELLRAALDLLLQFYGYGSGWSFDRDQPWQSCVSLGAGFCSLWQHDCNSGHWDSFFRARFTKNQMQ